MKKILFLMMLFPFLSFSANFKFQFNDQSVIYSDSKDSFIFMKSGKVFGIHKKTPIGAIGTYKIKGKKIIAYFTGIDGVKNQEIFIILNKKAIKLDKRIFKKEK